MLLRASLTWVKQLSSSTHRFLQEYVCSSSSCISLVKVSRSLNQAVHAQNTGTIVATSHDAMIARTDNTINRQSFGCVHVQLNICAPYDTRQLRHNLLETFVGNDRTYVKIAHSGRKLLCCWYIYLPPRCVTDDSAAVEQSSQYCAYNDKLFQYY